MRALLIAEKPDLARHVQKAYRAGGFKDQLNFMAFHGHIMQLCSPEDYNPEYKKWSLETLPIIPEKMQYKPMDHDTYKKLKDEINNGGYDYIINCCDPEREGQLIFYSFYEAIGCKLPVKRMWHSDLSEKELLRALNNMEDDINTPRLKHLTESSKIRAYIDWLIGMNASRAVTIKRGEITRIGRVIIPTLEILAKREREIKEFVPSTSYSLSAFYLPPNVAKSSGLNDNKAITIETAAADLLFKTKEEAQKHADAYKSDYGVVKEYLEKKQVRRSPQFMSTADLQAMANKVYGYTLQETLNIMQSLYEKKYLSYPRVECNHITKNVAMAIPEMLRVLEAIGCFGNELKIINRGRIKAIVDDKRYVDDTKVTSHYAITFTGDIRPMEDFTSDELDIIKLVGLNLIAALCDDYICTKQSLKVQLDDDIYEANGKIVLQEGWNEVLRNVSIGTILPKLTVGDKLMLDELVVTEKVATPPARYNDASIIKAMINVSKTIEDKELSDVLKGVGDSGGIGRPSTRAGIIEKLVMPIKTKGGEHSLVKRKNKSFYVTDEGMELADELSGFAFSSPELTAKWEKKLLDVEDGNLDSNELYEEVLRYTREMCNELIGASFTEQKREYNAEYLKDAKCPICGGKIKITSKYYLCEHFGKEDDKCKFIIGKELSGGKIKDKDVKDICNLKDTKAIKMKSAKTGKAFEASLYFDTDEKKIKMKFNNSKTNDTDYKCPVCGEPIKKNQSKYNAKEYYLYCKDHISIPLTICGHKLTNKEIKDLIEKRKTSLVKGLLSKSKKEFDAYLLLDKDGKVKFEFPKK